MTVPPVCGAKAALAFAVLCDLPAGHEGQHALHEDGKVYQWGPQLCSPMFGGARDG